MEEKIQQDKIYMHNMVILEPLPQMNAGPGINSSQGEFPKFQLNPDGSLNIKAPNPL